MTNPPVDEVRAVQASMIPDGEPYLSEAEIEDLHCLIRVTVEFFHFLESDLTSNREVARYMIDSVLSGVDSFIAISAAQRSLIASSTSSANWDAIRGASLVQQFLTIYKELR